MNSATILRQSGSQAEQHGRRHEFHAGRHHTIPMSDRQRRHRQPAEDLPAQRTLERHGADLQTYNNRELLERVITINVSISPLAADVNCGPLDGIDNGRMQLADSRTTFNATARYSCAENYTLVGAADRLCTARGTWEPSEPKCLCKCFWNESPKGFATQKIFVHPRENQKKNSKILIKNTKSNIKIIWKNPKKIPKSDKKIHQIRKISENPILKPPKFRKKSHESPKKNPQKSSEIPPKISRFQSSYTLIMSLRTPYA